MIGLSILAPLALAGMQSDAKAAAAAIVDQMLTAYASLDTYRDTGTLQMILNEGGHKTIISTRKFKTAYVRPLHLKVELDGTGPDGKPTIFAFTRLGATYKVYFSEFHRSHVFQTYDAAMAEAANGSNGVARTVPQALMIADVGEDAKHRWEDLTWAGADDFQGSKCDVLTATRGVAQFSYWVDRSTHLVVGMRKTLGNSMRTIETVVTYKPERNVKISPNEATFTAPNGEDFVKPPEDKRRHGGGGTSGRGSGTSGG